MAANRQRRPFERQEVRGPASPKHAAWVKPEIHTLKTQKALNVQTRPDQQEPCQRCLRLAQPQLREVISTR